MPPRKKITQKEQSLTSKKGFLKNRQSQILLGSFLMLFSIFLLFSSLSYLFTWKEDQSQLGSFLDKSVAVKNSLGKVGAYISHFLIYKCVGIMSLYIPALLFYTGYVLFLKESLSKNLKYWTRGFLIMIWGSVFLGLFINFSPILSGVLGYEITSFLERFLGKIGTFIILLFLLIAYLVTRFKIDPAHLIKKFDTVKHTLLGYFKKNTSEVNEKESDSQEKKHNHNEPLVANHESSFDLSVEDSQPTIKNHSKISLPQEKEIKEEKTSIAFEVETPKSEEGSLPSSPSIAINQTVQEKTESTNLADDLVENFGKFDPTLELSDFTFPPIDLLNEYSSSISINQEELEENKNKIVETLSNYKIGIANIKATIGPTVTLYEIIPEVGVRISKIKNLEDDIALSLAALGIRIIAPMPGKGTIGIEVPNKSPSIISMRSVLSSVKFQQSEMELPVALGKTISNETFVIDLAKTPHLLMAGATGQGKSVGLNAVLTSLLYKKHPAEVKFVLIDPKKVELTLFNKIERHYLAILPGSEEAIITDTSKVVTTLNSLCVEMDDRYNLLKTALVRNIKEYNQKFKLRKLNPENGHRFLPYIVLVIDEFADLIMTAGKEVEIPIARLAQLARAIGIHLIVATQRPSVNVITGIIKANFPSRIAFRVTSKIDSRTILDAPGADQLIGKGDLLYSGGNSLTRIQCAFVDTPEVEKITEYIGSQKAYPQAYQLPEYEDENSVSSLENNPDERDALFKDAALVIVNAQQGSASLLQRKLKLGYNRAGRIIDQLEAAGIVGPFEGSKARQVLIQDEISLNKHLE